MDGTRITSEEKSTISTYVGVIVAVILVAGALYFFFVAQREKAEVTGYDPSRPVPTDAVLKRRLKPEQYFIVRENGSQTPFQGKLYSNWAPGIYVDVITGDPLFSSVDKFESGLGMPTFSKPISMDAVVEKPDNSRGMQRIEIRSKRSDAHLGHLFGEPKSPTGRSYSINSAALNFIPQESMVAEGYEAFLPALEKK